MGSVPSGDTSSSRTVPWDYYYDGHPQGIVGYTREMWFQAGGYPLTGPYTSQDRILNRGISDAVKRRGPLKATHLWKKYIKNLPMWQDWFLYRRDPYRCDMFEPGHHILKPHWEKDWEKECQSVV